MFVGLHNNTFFFEDMMLVKTSVKAGYGPAVTIDYSKFNGRPDYQFIPLPTRLGYDNFESDNNDSDETANRLY